MISDPSWDQLTGLLFVVVVDDDDDDNSEKHLCLVSTIPLPFFRSVATVAVLRVRTEMLETSFRIHRDEVTRTLIGCPPTAERQK